MTSLPYLSTQAASDLLARLKENVPRYMGDTFESELSAPGAAMALPIDVDLQALGALDASKSEHWNSVTLWRALSGMTPSLARENRIWVRLCHGEGLEYARARWLNGKTGGPLLAAIRIHLFATTQTMCRDDNALGRLWWNAFIANRLDPENFENALDLILRKADIRSGFVERTWMTTRRPVGRAILQIMRSEPWVTAAETNFREVMKALNVEGAGRCFEAMTEARVVNVVATALGRARAAVDRTSGGGQV